MKIFTNKLVENGKFIRFLEIFPGSVSWSIIFLPIYFAITNPYVVMYFIIIYDSYWFFRSLNISRITLILYRKLKQAEKIDWPSRMKQTENLGDTLKSLLVYLNDIKNDLKKAAPNQIPALGAKEKSIKLSIKEINRLKDEKIDIYNWKKVYHVVSYATFRENAEILSRAVDALLKSDFPMSKVICVIAGEERDPDFRKIAKDLNEKYGQGSFLKFLPLEHPNGMPNEGKVKGAGVSWAIAEVNKMLKKEGIVPEQVIVSSFDSDTQVHKNYLAALTYEFIINPKRHKKSFQSIPLFHNNIWSAPAPNRVMAVNSSFWQMIESIRTRRLRNFAGHAMSMKALKAVDYWDRFSIVEDGKQYWRSFFAFNGDYSVIPIFVPVYNDVVLADTYLKTLKAQYLQRRRWYYGVSDFPFVVINAIKNKKIPLWYRLLQVWRHFEGTISLATASLILAFVAWLPLFLNPDFSNNSVVAHTLPVVTSRILTIAGIGLLSAMWISIILLPKKPKNTPATKSISMILQWFCLPPIAICLSTFPALESQTRLMFGKYIGFYVTPKTINKNNS